MQMGAVKWENYIFVFVDYAAFPNKNHTGEKQSYAVISIKYPMYFEDSITIESHFLIIKCRIVGRINAQLMWVNCIINRSILTLCIINILEC